MGDAKCYLPGSELDGSSLGVKVWTRDDAAGLQDALHNAEGVVHGAVHLVQHVVIRPPQQHARAPPGPGALRAQASGFIFRI